MLDALPARRAPRARPWVDPRAELIEGDVRDPGAWPRARSPAWTPSATRRRWSVWASTSATSPTTSPTTTSARPCCCRRSPRGGSPGGSCSGRAWSSTARGATAAPSTGSCAPAHAARPSSTPGAFEPPCPACGRALDRRARAGGRAGRPAQRLRGHQARAGAPVRRVRPRDRRGASPCCATTTSTAPDAARHAVRRRGQHLPLRVRRGPRARACSRTAGSGATSSTCATSPAPTCSRSTTPRPASTTSRPARRAPCSTWRARSAARSAARRSRWSPASGAPATSATSSPRRSGPRRELGFHAREDFAAGMREFAAAPQRA